MSYSVGEDNLLQSSCNYVEQIDHDLKKYSQGRNICDYVVIHYTAGGSKTSALNSFKNPNTQASWHLTIDREGGVSQLYDFRKIAWHAGRSEYIRRDLMRINGLNKWAIGIELIAWGQLTKKNEVYYSWAGTKVPAEEVYIDSAGVPFHTITEKQIKTCSEIVPALFKKYNCVDVVGHCEISPGRKTDPAEQGMKRIVFPLRKQLT